MELEGTGNFSFGYLNSLLDLATGLLYVGNGQYYDPATGRFLTRGVNPNNTNPYVPWNPIGILLGPLGMISANKARKKMKYAPALTITFLSLFMVACWVLVAIAVGGLLLTSCSAGNPAQETENSASATQSAEPATTPAITPTPAPSPNETPTEQDPCADGECTATPTPTPTPTGTVGIFGGSQGSGQLTYSGPAVPGVQMTAWTRAPEGYTLWYSQYPGYHDYRLADHPEAQDFWNDPKTNSQEANGYAGKPGQARWAFTYANSASSLPTILVGCSAGADAAVMHAELRQDSSFPVDALVLIDPAFYSYDLDGQLIGNDQYNQKLNGLNTRILILDTQNLWSNMSSSKIKYCQQADLNHENVDDDADLVDSVYQWVSTDQIQCSR
jgi:pimeloyl-ACP methyl ester carboxylesterase